MRGQKQSRCVSRHLHFTRSFYNRYYRSSYGTQAGAWLFNTIKSISAANTAITVTQFTHSFNQPSIIAKIPGTSANLGTLPSSSSHYLPHTYTYTQITSRQHVFLLGKPIFLANLD